MLMKQELFTLNAKRNVTLTSYLLDVDGEFSYIQKRPAVLVLPGGGYLSCSDREADPVALAYLEAGYHAFVLRYSVREDAVWPNPLEDYEQAMAFIRDHSEEWHIYDDKIAVIGFSAGGHLAACAATMSKASPNAAILGYAVSGADVKIYNPSAPDAIAAVNAHTCPCFVFATRNDGVVSIDNSIRFIEALARNGISFESHIYAYGPHGFSVCNSAVQSPDSTFCSRVPNWVPDSIAWLQDVFGAFCQEGLSAPKCGAHVNGDWDETLSIGCTIRHLMAHPTAKELVGGFFSQSSGGGFSAEQIVAMVGGLPLREVLGYGQTPAEALADLDQQLRQIKNVIIP